MGSLPKLRTPRAPLPPGLSSSLLSPSESPSAAAQPGLRSLLGSPTASATAASSQQGQLTAASPGLRQGTADSQALAAAVEHFEVSPESHQRPCTPWLALPLHHSMNAAMLSSKRSLQQTHCCRLLPGNLQLQARDSCSVLQAVQVQSYMPAADALDTAYNPFDQASSWQASVCTSATCCFRHATTRRAACGQQQNASCCPRERKAAGTNASLQKPSCAGPEHSMLVSTLSTQCTARVATSALLLPRAVLLADAQDRLGPAGPARCSSRPTEMWRCASAHSAQQQG